MDTPRLVARVARFADRERLFRRTQQLMLAVSGGPDSIAALLLLRELRQRFGFELTVAHFDHQLRPDSRADLEFVSATCERLAVPFLSGEGDVRSVARRQRKGIEETARVMRYQFLAFVAAEKRMDAIATGHTADDQAETILLRILRGTGVRGIRGMLPAGGVPGAPAQRLLRPLLVLSRDETALVCAEAGIVPRTDASNSDTTVLRNRVRHAILPLLAAVNPSVRDALLGLGESAREAFAETERRSFGVTPKERGPAGSIFTLTAFRDLPNEALTLVIEREAAFFKLEVEVNRTRLGNLAAVLRTGDGQVRFGDVAVECSAGLARIGPPLAAEPFEGRVLNVPGVTPAGPWRVQVATAALPAADGQAVARVDATAVSGALRVRRLQPGDRIRYHGIERKAAGAVATARIPAWERLGMLAIADGRRVHAILTASRVLEADIAGDDLLWVRVVPSA